MGRGDCGAGRRSCLHYRGLVAGELEAWRASKSKDLERRDVWCGPGKAWRVNLWCLEKQGPGEATRL